MIPVMIDQYLLLCERRNRRNTDRAPMMTFSEPFMYVFAQRLHEGGMRSFSGICAHRPEHSQWLMLPSWTH